MSAIFGIFQISGQAVAPGELSKMDAALSAHGPDNGGIWHNGVIGLGQRLMRYTPEDAFEQQPLKSDSDHLVLVSDSRIDNRKELARMLDILPSDTACMPDSAFILHAYQRWGEDCALYLAGAFAFALWDIRKQQLLLVRSQMGERPLYYHAHEQTVAFASLPKGLFALSHIQRKINHEFLADYLTLAFPTQGSSFYQGVHRLPAGCRLVVNAYGTTQTRYWHPDDIRELHLSRDEEYVEAFTEVFERVIADHLRSTTNVGVMMSGGYDSTAVAAVAATQLQSQGKNLATYTEVPRPGFDGDISKGRYADETPYVKAMVQMYDNICPNFIRSDKTFYLEDITKFFSASDMPFRNASNRPWFESILTEAKKSDTRVLLTGASGNLTISWDGMGLLSQLVQNRQFVRAWHESGKGSALSRFRRLISQGILPLLPNHTWRLLQLLRQPTGISEWMRPPWVRYSPINLEFANEQRVNERARQQGQDFLFRQRSNTKHRRIATLSLLDSYNAGDYTSAYHALAGIDLRDPTGDSRLVTFCLSVPEDQYRRNCISRWLLRRAMADRLPAMILNNQRRGLQSAGWFEVYCASQPQIHEELSHLKSSPLVSGVLDLKRMEKLLDSINLAATKSSAIDHIMYDYRHVMEHGLMIGRFLRWIEAGEAC